MRTKKKKTFIMIMPSPNLLPKRRHCTFFSSNLCILVLILYHLGMAWDLRWTSFDYGESINVHPKVEEVNSEPVILTMDQLSWLNMECSSILERTQLHMNLPEPFIAFRRVLLQISSCRDCTVQHLLQSTSTLRKGSRFSQAAAALHEFKFLSVESVGQDSSLYWLGVGDWPFLKCREHMANGKEAQGIQGSLWEVQPAEWFEKRLSYTRSVAASSMVGYIVDLRDRHSVNILIDQTTAEVVHIDLGIAFEQGLMLKTPERSDLQGTSLMAWVSTEWKGFSEDAVKKLFLL